MMALKHMRRLAICQLKPKKSSKEEEEIIVVAKGTSIYGHTPTPMGMVLFSLLVLHVMSECHYVTDVIVALCSSRELCNLKPSRCAFSLISLWAFRTLNQSHFTIQQDW